MQTIYLVRHGETEWNRAGRMQGRQDSPLTPRGEDQARRVGALLHALIPEPDTCLKVVSPLGRTLHTATLICEGLGIDPDRFEVDPRVQEVGWGDWEGLTHAEIAATDPDRWSGFRADRWSQAPPGGESYCELAERARRWLTATNGYEHVLLISHGAFGRALRGHYLGLDAEETLALSVPQDAVFRLAQGTASRIDAD